MNSTQLVKMVNEIAAFFHSESPAAQAPQDVASHLRRFWDPRMRREIIAHSQQGGAGLSDLARRALQLLEAGSG
jgi:formate dehydrogenase subunit delta